MVLHHVFITTNQMRTKALTNLQYMPVVDSMHEGSDGKG